MADKKGQGHVDLPLLFLSLETFSLTEDRLLLKPRMRKSLIILIFGMTSLNRISTDWRSIRPCTRNPLRILTNSGENSLETSLPGTRISTRSGPAPLPMATWLGSQMAD